MRQLALRPRLLAVAMMAGLVPGLAPGLVLGADMPGTPGTPSGALLRDNQDPSAIARQSGQVAELPPGEELERRGAVVGHIDVAVDDIFDVSDPRENRALYRLANKLHLDTKDTTVLSQVLFQTGDTYSVRQAEETARILREKRYLYDAVVEPTAYDPETNTVDLLVRVRDVWSLSPGFGVGRSGGENKTRARIVDENFLGRGQYLAVGYTSTVDRSGISLDFRDQNLFRSWWAMNAGYTDSSDGSTVNLAVGRPFFSLDTRWSAGMNVLTNEQITPLYDLGEKVDEFRQESDLFGIQGGWSRGLIDGWTTRWLTGFRYDRSRFEESFEDVPTVLLPEDRTLSYPWVGVELIQDRFETTHNQDQIGRTEDVYLGKTLRLELGWTADAFGGDRSAGIFGLTGRLGNYVGERGLVFVESFWNGRLESGSLADSLLSTEARYYLRFNDKNVFTAAVEGQHGFDLDIDHQLLLGGDTGLRGYPLRYQGGDTRALISVEERYFTDWFPFRLARVGGAIFADVGRTWGEAPLASEPQGWLTDVGFGLRLGNARSGLGNVLHIDLAFPIGASSDISSMQVLLEAKKTF
ncbi:MAG: BamA/TamA family outer membrane protein [Gammaproteobacteria bacterium]